MRQGSPWVLTLLLLVAALSGCIGAGDQADELAETATASQNASGASAAKDPAAATDLASVRFDGGPAENTTIWANGTYQAHEGCLTGGCMTGAAWHPVELSSELSREAPNHIRVELSYDPGAIPFIDPLGLGIYSESGTFYSFDYEGSSGLDVADFTFLPDGEPLIIEPNFGAPGGAQAEIDYTLRIDISQPTGLVLPRMPVELAAEPGQGFTIASATGEGTPEVLVYGPGDAYITTLTSQNGPIETTVPPDVPAGKHVLVPSKDSPPIRLETNGSQPVMRALGYAFEAGEGHPVDGQERVTWQFELASPPLAVGVYSTTGDQLGVSLDDGNITLEGPNGTVLEDDLGCNFCLTTGYYTAFGTALADPSLTAGTYEASYEPGIEEGYSVGHWTLSYER